MSQTANKTAVGAFVVVAALLAFACIVFFGNISFNNKTVRFVIYVADSVNGLDVGSAVKFKGVKIGSVSRIVSVLSPGANAKEIAVPVVIEVDNSAGHYSAEGLKTEINRGLRARLQMTSIVTGLLYVDLDYIPDSPVVFRDKGLFENYPEIPTISSNTSQMVKAVSTLLDDLSRANFSALSAQLLQTVLRIDQSVAQIEFEKINGNVVRLTDSAVQILEDPELKKTAENLNRLLANIDALSTEIAGQVDPVATELKIGLGELHDTLEEISLAINSVQKVFSTQQGSLGQELGETLAQINDAARSIRALTDSLQVQLSLGDAGQLPKKEKSPSAPNPVPANGDNASR